jgi:DNA gyrase subunit A
MVRDRLRHSEAMLVLSRDGQAFTILGSELPPAARSGRGTALKELVEWPKQGTPVLGAIIRDFAHPLFVTMVTAAGQVKRTAISEFRNARLAGIRAIRLDAGDRVVAAALTGGQDDLLVATAHGQVIRFHESDVRDMGRDAAGVRAITLKDKDTVVALAVAGPSQEVCAGTSDGTVKRITVESVPLQGRGGQGVQLFAPTEKVGSVVGIVTLAERTVPYFLTGSGAALAVEHDALPVVARAAKGTRVSDLPPGQSTVALVGSPEE